MQNIRANITDKVTRKYTKLAKHTVAM